MKCARCGYDNVTGTKFCENCGAKIAFDDPDRTQLLPPEKEQPRSSHRICPRCGSLVEGSLGVCRACGYRLSDSAVTGHSATQANREKRDNGVLKMILLGAGIGLAVLAAIFGTMYFLNGDREDSSSKEVTVPVETSAEEQYTVPDQEDTGFYDQNEGDSRTGNSDYSTYIDEPESRLYTSNVPIFFPDSDSRRLGYADVRDMSENQIQKIVNDIYARNGYSFKNNDFSNYYYGFDWYRPDTNDMDQVRSRMNNYEKENVEFLKDLT